MAVNIEFTGPVIVESGRKGRIAQITGVDHSRFDVVIDVTPSSVSGRKEITESLVYQDASGRYIAKTSGHIFMPVDARPLTIPLNIDVREFSSVTLTFSGQGNFTVTDVRIDGYKGPLPELPEPRKNAISFNIERLVPRFLLADRNGYALAKAIERAFQIVAEGAKYGLEILKDPYKMPEWRLDELAWELGCLYDNNGTIEQKRYWIINATYLYSVYGTPQAIYNFLEGYFQTVQVEENWEYDGDPFHFRVTVSGGDYSADKIAWAQKAIMNVKNLRSVLDDVTFDNSAEIIVSGDFDWAPVSYFFDLSGLNEITSGNGIETWLNAEDIDVDPALTDEARTDEGVTL